MIKIIQIPGTGTGSGSGKIKVEDEGILLGEFTTLNFIGVDVEAQVGDPDEANIYIPPPPPASYASHFNTNDGTYSDASVGNISTTNRYISSPTSEGTPFKIGDWTADTLKSTINTGPLTYSTNAEFSILNNTATTFTVIVYDADGSSALATHSFTITGNYNQTVQNIQIVITNFAVNEDKYMADISISIDIDSILPNGGRFSVYMEHDDGADGTFTKTQNDIFYDTNNNTASLTGVSIGETAGQVVTTFLSGVEYYALTSQFTVNISDLDYLNDRSYPADQVTIQGSEYGLPTLTPGRSELTSWTNIWNNTNASYNKTNWAITQVDYYALTTLANIRARTQDWVSGSWVNSSNASVAINTYDDQSTRTIERFWEEEWRCDGSSDFDDVDQKGWDSTVDLGTDDACFWDGGCGHCEIDFTIYDPNKTNQPDYSTGRSGSQYLWRECKHNGSASSGMRINIAGSYTSLKYKLAKAWDGTLFGGTVWVDALKDYNAGDWNNGNPQNNTGGKVATGTNYIDVTFGSNNIINTGDTVYLEIEFEDGEKITTLNVVFT